VHRKPCVLRKEENYFFALSKYQKQLEELCESPGGWAGRCLGLRADVSNQNCGLRCRPPSSRPVWRVPGLPPARSLPSPLLAADFVQPESRRNEVLGWVREGVRDFSISRAAVEWGIPVPRDPRQTVYVWFDALNGYLSGVLPER
jgi:methionyl-tRNA synthetase